MSEKEVKMLSKRMVTYFVLVIDNKIKYCHILLVFSKLEVCLLIMTKEILMQYDN